MNNEGLQVKECQIVVAFGSSFISPRKRKKITILGRSFNVIWSWDWCVINNPYSPYSQGNVKMFHKIGCLAFWNLTVCILVDSKESPEEEKIPTSPRFPFFLYQNFKEKMSTHSVMIGSVKFRNSWKSTFWSMSLSKSGFKPAVGTYFIIFLQP